jgi:hypothetical protein
LYTSLIFRGNEQCTYRVASNIVRTIFRSHGEKSHIISSCILSEMFSARVSLRVIILTFCPVQFSRSLHDTVAVRPYVEISELREEQLTF